MSEQLGNMGLDKATGPDDILIAYVTMLAKQDIRYLVEAMHPSTTTRTPRNMDEEQDGADIQRKRRYKGKCMLDCSNSFTLFLPWQTCSFRHQLGFSWKHSSHAAIAQRLFTHMPTTVYSQVLIYTAESTEAS